LKKGSGVLVEGRMQTRSWDDAGTGTKKYRTEVIADRVQFGPKAGGAPFTPSTGSATQAPVQEDDKKALDTIEYPEEDINPEDIPF
jgi:single-strand DNA-binding protein